MVDEALQGALGLRAGEPRTPVEQPRDPPSLSRDARAVAVRTALVSSRPRWVRSWSGRRSAAKWTLIPSRSRRRRQDVTSTGPLGWGGRCPQANPRCHGSEARPRRRAAPPAPGRAGRAIRRGTRRDAGDADARPRRGERSRPWSTRPPGAASSRSSCAAARRPPRRADQHAVRHIRRPRRPARRVRTPCQAERHTAKGGMHGWNVRTAAERSGTAARASASRAARSAASSPVSSARRVRRDG